MKINELKNLNNYSFCANQNEKELVQQKKTQINEFSPDYANATKALASVQIEQKTFEEKQEELIKELTKRGIFETETDAGYFVYYYVNPDNYALAKTIFDYKRIPTKTAIGIVKKTYKEIEHISQEMVKDEEFSPEHIEDILLSTHLGNIKSSLAAIKNKDIPRDVISQYLKKINTATDKAASLILADKEMTPYTRQSSFGMLNAMSAQLIELAYSLFDEPHPASITCLAGKQDIEDIEFMSNILYLFASDTASDRDELINAVYALNKRNEKEIIEIFRELIPDKTIPRDMISQVVSTEGRDNHHGRKKVLKTLKDDTCISKNDLMSILLSTTNKDANLKVSVYEDLKDNPVFPKEYLGWSIAQVQRRENQFVEVPILPEGFIEGAKKFSEIHKHLLKNPQLYINGEADNIEEAQEEINDFIKDNIIELCGLSAIFDKETMDLLFRGRLENVEEYIDKYSFFAYDEPNLLSRVYASKNKEGNDFSPKEKIELLDLLNAMSSIRVSFDSVREAVFNGRIDVEALQKDLFSTVLKSAGLNEEEIDEEKIKAWDLKYIPYLAQELEEMSSESDDTLEKIMCAACTEYDFKDYIQGDNEFGWANSLTQERFEKLGLDYNAWLNPSKNNEIQFSYIDSNQEKLTQIIAQIEEDIEALRKTPAKGFVDKHFSDCISNDKFKINEKYSKNKQSLETFVKNMFELLENNIFKRAKANLENPNKKQNAQMTLTIKSHLEQRLEDIKNADISKKQKPLDLTIKMWDRNPIYDLFQGNYSTCCIGLTRGNGSAMPNYLGYSAFNMIELVDNNSNQTIGNALCYFAIDENQKPVFVIDNIEIANKFKPSDEGGLKLRNAILEYAQNVLKEVGAQDFRILLGTNYNDVPDDDLKEFKERIRIVGAFNCDQLYADAFGGWFYEDSQQDAELSLAVLK